MAWQKTHCAAQRSADLAAAKEKALDLACGREFSAQSLYERLCRRFTEQAAAYAVCEAQRLGAVDDARYAAARARSLQLQHRSRRAITQDLKAKGVAGDIIEAALEDLFAAQADPDAAAALALVTRQYARRLAQGREDLVLAALLRRGFSYRVARDAILAAQAA